jgi:hypothetical protein
MALKKLCTAFPFRSSHIFKEFSENGVPATCVQTREARVLIEAKLMAYRTANCAHITFAANAKAAQMFPTFRPTGLSNRTLDGGRGCARLRGTHGTNQTARQDSAG